VLTEVGFIVLLVVAERAGEAPLAVVPVTRIGADAYAAPAASAIIAKLVRIFLFIVLSAFFIFHNCAFYLNLKRKSKH